MSVPIAGPTIIFNIPVFPVIDKFTQCATRKRSTPDQIIQCFLKRCVIHQAQIEILDTPPIELSSSSDSESSNSEVQDSSDSEAECSDSEVSVDSSDSSSSED